MTEQTEALLLKIDADITSFSEKLDEVTKQTKDKTDKQKSYFDDLGKRLDKIAGKAVRWGAAMTAAAVAATAALTKVGINSARSLQVQADAIGISTDALRDLQAAADSFGLSQEVMVVAMRNSAKAVGEASRGMVEQTKVLNRLGLSLDALKKQSPDEQFYSLATAISEVKNPAEQTALAMKVFQEQGFALLPALRKGKDGIMANIEAYRGMGTALSDLENRMGAAASGGLEDLNLAFQDFTRMLASAAAPTVIFITDQLKNLIAGAGGATGIIEKMGTGFKFAAKIAGDAWQGFGFILNAIALGASKLGVVFWETTGAVIDAAKRAEMVLDGVFIRIGAAWDLLVIGLKSIWTMTWTSIKETASDALIAMANQMHTTGAVMVENGIKGGIAMQEMSDSIRASANDMKKNVPKDIKEMAEQSAAAMVKLAEGGEKIKQGFFGEMPLPEFVQGQLDAATSAVVSFQENLYKTIDDISERGTLGSVIVGDITKIEEDLTAALEAKIAFNESLVASEEQTVNRLQQLREDLSGFTANDIAENERLFKASWRAKADFASTVLGNLSTLMQGESKKQFQVGKAAATADAVVQTILGATRALGTVPYPFNFVAAASVMAAGFANVQKIQSQQFGGGASGGGSSGGPATQPAIQGQSAAAAAGNSGVDQRVVNMQVNLHGQGGYSANQVRGLISSINDQTADGAQLNLRAG